MSMSPVVVSVWGTQHSTHVRAVPAPRKQAASLVGSMRSQCLPHCCCCNRAAQWQEVEQSQGSAATAGGL